MPKNKNVKKNRPMGGAMGGGGGALREKEAHEDYAVITRVLGGGNVLGQCSDGLTRRIVIRGAIRRRGWIKVNDVLIVELRHGMSNGHLVADVAQQALSAEEVAVLKRSNAIPHAWGTGEDAGGDDGFVFDEEEEEEEVDVANL